MILRTVAWDGLPPAAGDVVQLPDGTLHVVDRVAEGAGVGHWRLECRPARVIQWRPATWVGA